MVAPGEPLKFAVPEHVRHTGEREYLIAGGFECRAIGHAGGDEPDFRLAVCRQQYGERLVRRCRRKVEADDGSTGFEQAFAPDRAEIAKRPGDDRDAALEPEATAHTPAAARSDDCLTDSSVMDSSTRRSRVNVWPSN